MSDDNDTRMAEYLTENPRLIGALFTMMLLLSQSSSAAATTAGHLGP